MHPWGSNPEPADWESLPYPAVTDPEMPNRCNYKEDRRCPRSVEPTNPFGGDLVGQLSEDVADPAVAISGRLEQRVGVLLGPRSQYPVNRHTKGGDLAGQPPAIPPTTASTFRQMAEHPDIGEAVIAEVAGVG